VLERLFKRIFGRRSELIGLQISSGPKRQTTAAARHHEGVGWRRSDLDDSGVRFVMSPRGVRRIPSVGGEYGALRELRREKGAGTISNGDFRA